MHTHTLKKTILADETDYIWDPNWYHDMVFNIPSVLSSEPVQTIYSKDSTPFN